ncbi:ABC transporter ATP-binding protein [Streptomyces sp. NL15-2K]|uniref:ABC transporter ATP-binding protein n=1 Tax=Streptomyces sp. NL15-2K TaxID=376149 RepID=UPI000FF9E198|nr:MULTISPECIES: ABC transporter ATP-binding protein [Actinomycetes]WKX09221.1 ABC transporter ATP-binding protein [Kutzneria buriramensis]GCB49298.1 lipid A export ATP-binding/permease protein msbA [Streptomyces sp. NL15-2K]
MAAEAGAAKIGTREQIACLAFAVRLVWRADRRRLIEVVIAQLASALGIMALILLVRNVFGTVLAAGSGPGAGGGRQAIVSVVLIVAIGSLGGVLRLFSSSRNRVLAAKADRHVISTVLASATRAELARFEDPVFHDALQRAVFASRSQPTMVVAMLVAASQAALTALAVGAAFVVMAWWLLPVAFLSALPVLRAARAERNAGYGLHRRLAEDRRVRQYVEQLLTGRDGAKEVRALDLGRILRARWDAEYEREIDDIVSWQRGYLRTRIAARLGSDAMILAIIGSVWWLIGSDVVSLPTAVAAVTGLFLMTSRVQALGALLNGIGESLFYLMDLRTFAADADSEADSEPVPPPPGGPSGDGFTGLSAESIDFTYPGSPRPALRDVTLTVRRGEFIALVGENGSGKTTLAKILGGLYPPDSGRLVLDGTPAPDPARLRETCAPVFQDFLRYKFTAGDSIAFGRADVPPDTGAIVAAAERAGAHAFLERLPRGYDTVLGKEFSDGCDLSLGQWQRLALARAFYRDSPFLILDEPTASLDPQAEADLADRLRALFADRTVLLISHRFSAVRGADRIYVMAGGRVVEQGRHEELMAENGTYARLFRLQALPYHDDSAKANADNADNADNAARRLSHR